MMDITSLPHFPLSLRKPSWHNPCTQTKEDIELQRELKNLYPLDPSNWVCQQIFFVIMQGRELPSHRAEKALVWIALFTPSLFDFSPRV